MQVLSPIEEPPFQIYELVTTTQGVLQVQAKGSVSPAVLGGGLFVDPGTSAAPSDQDGSIGAPFSTVQAGCNALQVRGGGTLILVPGSYAPEAVTIDAFTPTTLFALGATDGGTVDLVTVTITTDSALALVNVANVGGITSTSRVLLQNSNALNAPLTADSLQLRDASIAGGTVANEVQAFDSRSTDAITCSSLRARNCTLETLGAGYFISGLIQAWDTELFADTLANSTEYTGCTLSGAHTGSSFVAFQTRMLGTVNVTVTASVDQFTFQSAAPSSWVATNGVFVVDAPWSAESFQIGWNAGVPSTALQVLLANQHPPGLYLIYAPIIVRTIAGAGTVTRTISWSAPTIGAQSKVDAGTAISTTTGTKLQDVVAIVSDGSADVVVQYTPVGVAGVPAIDVYASALQGGKATL
jgi:hypothetical protein